MPTLTVQHKTFTYQTSADWLGRRSATMYSPGKGSFRVSSPPEFRGESHVWTPEDLFVASVESCFLMTFAGLVERRHLAVKAYYSQAEGTLEYVDGGYRFTRVTIKPTVLVTDSTDIDPVMTALRDAKRQCLVSRSIETPVVIEPDLELSIST